MADISGNGRLRSESGQLYVVARPSSGIPDAILRNEGWAIDAFGYSFVEDAGSAVPTGARFIDGVAHTQDGAMYVTDTTPAATATYRQGFAIRADGAMHINSGSVSGSTKKEGILVTNGRMFISSDIYKNANLAAWHRFGVGLTDAGAGACSAWADQSGNTRNLTAAGSARPTIQADKSLLFDGVANVMATSAFVLNQPSTIYFLSRQVTWTAGDTWSDGALNTEAKIRQGSVSPNLALNAGVLTSDLTGLVVNTYGVTACIFNGASSGIQINNNAIVIGNAGANNMSGFTLGSQGGAAANFANIQVKEVILFSAAHDAATRGRVIKYLATVGGLSI